MRIGEVFISCHPIFFVQIAFAHSRSNGAFGGNARKAAQRSENEKMVVNLFNGFERVARSFENSSSNLSRESGRHTLRQNHTSKIILKNNE